MDARTSGSSIHHEAVLHGEPLESVSSVIFRLGCGKGEQGETKQHDEAESCRVLSSSPHHRNATHRAKCSNCSLAAEDSMCEILLFSLSLSLPLLLLDRTLSSRSVPSEIEILLPSLGFSRHVY